MRYSGCQMPGQGWEILKDSFAGLTDIISSTESAVMHFNDGKHDWEVNQKLHAAPHCGNTIFLVDYLGFFIHFLHGHLVFCL